MSENEVQETEANVNDETVEATTTEVNTDRSINAPLDEIDDPETLKQMVKKLRGENAKGRVTNQSLKEKAEKFDELERSKMSELEKAQARVKELEDVAREKTRENVLIRFGLVNEDGTPSDLAEFVDGTEEEMIVKAEKLVGFAGRVKQAESDTSGLVPGLFREPGGKPVKPKTTDGAGFLEYLAENGRYN